ncbi:MAG: EF-P lysine aminoacylase GenX [Thiotrichales bacterium]|nr:MAG: EF-P lysine aminoacylase GenX [Thiotrichales bacterium]
MSERWQPAASREIIHLRARMLKDIRAFFDQRGVLEVETPLLSSAATTDPNLNSFSTRYLQQELYLNTSPEYCMKRMLAVNGDAIYQICKSFRDDELGPLHNPEFTMLEWYRPGYDMFELMDELGELIRLLAVAYGLVVASIEKVSYAEAFMRSAGIDPHKTSAAECRDCALEHGIEQPVGLTDDVDGWLDWLLTQLLMPSFPSSGLTYLYDYPSSQAALAKLRRDRNGNAVAARFELFYGATELANGFDELLDAAEQRQRFEQENSHRRSSGLQSSVIDEQLLAALEQGLPACSGVALGLDRLLMLLAGADTLDQVLTFPFSRI